MVLRLDNFPRRKKYVLNTEITALRSFKIEELLVIKTMVKEKSTDSPACDPSKLSDEIKYLRENCIIQRLLERLVREE